MIPQCDIIVEGIDIPPYLDSLETYLDTLVNLLGESNWEMSLTLCNNEYIAQLNEQYRKKSGPTDVLTFVMEENSEEFPISLSREIPRAVGDIIVSLEKVKENSHEWKIPFDEELKRVILHGVLHLKGMTHEEYDWNDGMLKEQEILLNKFSNIRFTGENETFLD